MAVILLIEDDQAFAETFQLLLEIEHGTAWQVPYVPSLTAATEWLTTHQADAIVLDLNLQDSEGLATLYAMLDVAPGIPIIVLTCLTDPEIQAGVTALGRVGYCSKNALARDSCPFLALLTQCLATTRGDADG